MKAAVRRPQLWLSPVVGLVGAWLGLALLPMRWWRHGDISLFVPATMLVAIAMTVVANRSSLRLLASMCWLLWALMLVQVLLWISAWNPHLTGSAVWGATVVLELILVWNPRPTR